MAKAKAAHHALLTSPLATKTCTAVCCTVCCCSGESNSQLIDKLRTEEAKRMQTDLKKAKAELERRASVEKQLQARLAHLQAEAQGLRNKVRDQGEVIERMQMEVEGVEAADRNAFGSKQGKSKSRLFR